MDDMIEYLLLHKLCRGGVKRRPSVLSFHLTSELTQPIYLTQSAANAVTVDWGDGSAQDNPSDLSASLSHTYATAGDYTVRITCAEGETWGPGLTSGSDNYGIIGKFDSKGAAYPTLVGFIFGDGATVGHGYGFYGCTGLESISIPDGTTHLELYDFMDCTGLEQVEIPDTVSVINRSAFKNCTSLSEISLPKGLRTIGENSFSGCSALTEIELPPGVTDIGTKAFLNCSGLTEIALPDGLTNIGSNAFQGCSALTAITIPSSVTSIGSGAFIGCASLFRVNVTDLAAWCMIDFGSYSANPISIAGSIYINGTKITDLLIPSGLSRVKDYAFYKADISSITSPESVSIIGLNTFYGCANVGKITMQRSVPPTISNTTLSGIPADCPIYVPADYVVDYQTANNWSARAAYIQADPNE